ncbi:hypothetical protein TcWFU_009896 [Taenia crassiceps]|uniref:Uncharacterized protein n=1 Tax=Taenia crassiceps TaxID=6207 RepID=A0ABR4Q2U0_9CEST
MPAHRVPRSRSSNLLHLASGRLVGRSGYMAVAPARWGCIEVVHLVLRVSCGVKRSCLGGPTVGGELRAFQLLSSRLWSITASEHF